MEVLITEHEVSIGKTWCKSCRKVRRCYLRKYKIGKGKNNTKIFCQKCDSLIRETNKLPIDDMDKEVIPVCELLNNLKGITTIASCSGHGKSETCFVTFVCTNFKSLKYIVDAVASIHHKIYGDSNLFTDNWAVEILSEWSFGSNAILGSIKLRPYIPKEVVVEVDADMAWSKLMVALKKSVEHKYPRSCNHPQDVTNSEISSDMYLANTGIAPWW